MKSFAKRTASGTRSRRLLLGGLGLLSLPLALTSALAFACIHGPGMTVGPGNGPAGSTAIVRGSAIGGFRGDSLELRQGPRARHIERW